jgi:carbohydrate kinase (thermoresistant glucokinase family)
VSGTPTRLVVMGVAGAGKTTVGERLAEAIGVPFLDADSLHPGANVAQMRAGVPLGDAERLPWLEAVGRALGAGPTVLACSALRRTYRDLLRLWAPDAVFVHLTADPVLLERRTADRADHFLPASLLRSQLAALEPLGDDEHGFAVDNRLPLDQVIEAVLRSLPRSAGPIPISTGATA